MATKRGKKYGVREPRLGVDVGRVIIAGDGPDTSFLGGSDDDAMGAPEVVGAFEALTRLRERFGGRVWLVSKCGPRIQARTRRWLAERRFFEITGIAPRNLIFCRSRSEKAPICARLGVTCFVDDRRDVLAAMDGLVPSLLLFGASAAPGADFVAVAGWEEAERTILATLQGSSDSRLGLSSPSMVFSQDQYFRALTFAARAHAEQKTPTGLPYLAHVAQVCMEVIEALHAEPGHDGDLAVAVALMHDVVEDTATTLEQIAAEFGLRVAAGVSALTKDASLEKPAAMQDSLARILRQPPEIAMVKLADRVTNLAPPPPHWSPGKIADYREEGQRILDALGAASPALSLRLMDRLRAYPAPSAQGQETR